MSETLEDELAFILPPAEAKKVILKSVLILTMVLIIITFIVKIKFNLSVAIFLAAAHVAGYFLIIRHKYIFISPDYFRGESALGRNAIIGWHEEIKVNETHLNGLSGYNLKNKSLLNFIFLPKAIANSEDFQSAVAKFSPKNHILLSLKST